MATHLPQGTAWQLLTELKSLPKQSRSTKVHMLVGIGVKRTSVPPESLWHWPIPAVGVDVGVAVGAGVGLAVGASVVGVAVGADVGTAEGAAVGVAVGTVVGPGVGAVVGKAAGDALGAVVGAPVGDAVGTVVGPAVGAIVGAATGDALGAVVGAPVGDAVGAQVTVMGVGGNVALLNKNIWHTSLGNDPGGVTPSAPNGQTLAGKATLSDGSTSPATITSLEPPTTEPHRSSTSPLGYSTACALMAPRPLSLPLLESKNATPSHEMMNASSGEVTWIVKMLPEN
jgi:hypothetical protein